MKSLAYYLQIIMALSTLIVGLIYFLYNWKKGLFQRLLAILLVVTSIGVIISFLAINNYFLIFPHLSRTGFLIAFIVPTLLYFTFFKGLLKKPFTKTDLLHFLPLLIYVINYLPYFLSSRELKLKYIKLEIIGSFSEGWLLPAYFIPILSFIQTSFYIYYFWMKARQLNEANVPKLYVDKYYYFGGYMLIHYMPVFLAVLKYYDRHEIQSWLPVIYSIANTFFFLKIIATPAWLFSKYNVKKSVKTPQNSLGVSELLQRVDKKLTPKLRELTAGEKDMLTQFLAFSQKEKHFLQTDFNQKNLAKELQSSEYKIRVMLEKAFQMNFVEINNYLKIRYLLTNYKNKESGWKLLKMNTISEKLGYKSLNSFYLNFKKITGVTPGEFFNQNTKD